MIGRNSPLFGAVLLLVDAGAFSSLFAVFLLVETGTLMFPALPVWCACLLGGYLTLCLLLRRPRAQRTLILVCAGFFLLQGVAAFALYGRFAGNMGLVITLSVWLATYFHAYGLALQPPTAEKMMTSFEICVLILLFSLFYCSVQHISYISALPAAAAAAVALAGLIARRTASGREKTAAPRGAGTVLGVLAAFALGALLVAGAAAGAVKSVVLVLWSAAKAVAAFLGRCASALLRWLVSLLPEPEGEELLMDPQAYAIPEGAMDAEGLVDPAVVMQVLLGLLALGLLGALVYLVVRGGGRLRRRVYTAGGPVTRRRTGPDRALKKWLARLRESLRFQLLRLLRRDTAPGLFVWLERRNALRGRGRRASESCQEYLQRLAQQDIAHVGVLLVLADDLDAYYFGSGSRLTKRQIRAMRKMLSGKGKPE